MERVPRSNPHSVAMRARALSARPSEHPVMEQRKQEAARNKVLDFTKDQSNCGLRTHWEKNTERQIMSTVERRVKEAMEQYELSIDERRERLREMLESEEREFLEEMEAMENNIMFDQQARIYERVKYLREKREKERKKVVADKLDQLFREQSEEVRVVEARRREKEVSTDRAAQIQTKQEEHRLWQEEEMLFSKLWESDRLAKEERENMKVERQRLSNLDQLAFLRTQMETTEQQRLQAKQLKEEEAQLLHEQREMLRLEEQREYIKKNRKKENRRKQLDHSLRLKMKRLAQEQQDELALDMSILEQLLAEEKDEKNDVAVRKLELRKEQYMYRQYLAKQLEEQRKQEAETEQLMEADLQQAMAHRSEKRRLEKLARDQLMQEVLDTRRLQIQSKLARNAQKQAELDKERDEMNRTIEKNKLLDEQEKTRLRDASKEHQTDLLAQILQQQRLHDEKQAKEEKEYQKSLDYQEKYNQKVQDILSRPNTNMVVHPFRRRSQLISS